MFFTMSPGDFSVVITSDNNGGVTISYASADWSQHEGNVMHGERGVRPVINIRADAIVESGNGQSGSNAYKINLNERTTDYKTTTTMKVYPDPGYEYDTTKGVTCTNGQSGSYNKTNNTLTINSPSKETECTVNFKQLPKLADKIIADAKSKNIYKTTTPDFTIGEPPESGSSATGSGLFTAQDDKETSYYFRGDKTLINNYVRFAGFNWRVVRINGDKTIRLILDDRIGFQASFNNLENRHNLVGYTYNNTSCTNSSPCESTYNNGPIFNNANEQANSNIKTKLEEWYYDNLKDYDDKIAYATYCNDTSYGSGDDDTYFTLHKLYYGPYTRIVSGSNRGHPILTCPDPTDQNNTMRTYGGVYQLKIGLLSADEMNYAGLSYSSSKAASSNNYLYKSYDWWSMSPSNSGTGYADVFYGNGGAIKIQYVSFTSTNVRPVINLNADTLTTSGDGSSSSPYEVH